MSISQISTAACEDRLPLIPRGRAAPPAFHSAVLPMRARTRGAAGTSQFFIAFREIRPKYCTLLFWHSQSTRQEKLFAQQPLQVFGYLKGDPQVFLPLEPTAPTASSFRTSLCVAGSSTSTAKVRAGIGMKTWSSVLCARRVGLVAPKKM